MPVRSFFSSRRERNLWLGAAVATALIYASLAFVRTPIEWLRQHNLLRLSVAAIFVAVALAVLVWVVRRRPGRRELAVLVLSAGVYLAALLLVDRHEERLHFLEYGVVGGLVYSALRERLRRSGAGPWWAAVGAVVITGLAGWGDEGIQALLPNRVYELRDAGLNLSAALLIVFSLAALEWAQRGDRRAGSG